MVHELLGGLEAALNTVRFEVMGEMEPCPDDGHAYDDWDSGVWDCIEDLVKYRFDQGRPFSTIEAGGQRERAGGQAADLCVEVLLWQSAN